jgi:hypothetical protein
MLFEPSFLIRRLPPIKAFRNSPLDFGAVRG